MVGGRLLRVNEESVSLAARLIRNGGMVAFPTDTVYGLGCDPFSEEAVRRLFEVKGRAAKPVPVLCVDLSTAETLVELNRTALDLAQKYWPGPLTIVAPLKAKVPALLDQGRGLLGVRVPDSPVCALLLGRVGGRMTGTSANLSGSPSCRTAEDVLRSLGESVDLILDGGRLREPESAVVQVDEAGVEVLRRGKISLESQRGETGRRI